MFNMSEYIVPNKDGSNINDQMLISCSNCSTKLLCSHYITILKLIIDLSFQDYVTAVNLCCFVTTWTIHTIPTHVNQEAKKRRISFDKGKLKIYIFNIGSIMISTS